MLSHSALLSELALNGAIGMIAGAGRNQAPTEGVLLDPGERERLGLKEGGTTLFYATGEDGVFFDLAGSQATLWFHGGDCDTAIQTFDQALRQAYPTVKDLGETQNPNDSTMRSRGYEVDLGQGKLAALDVAFPSSPAGKRQFAVRVFALRRTV